MSYVNLNVTITKNNTKIALSNQRGDVFHTKNGGSSDVSKKSKAACITVCTDTYNALQEKMVKKVRLKFKGDYKKWRRFISFFFYKRGVSFIALSDITSFPHNGCRKKKKKQK